MLKLILGFVLSLLQGPGGIVQTTTNGLLLAQKQKLDATNDAQRIAAERDVEMWSGLVSYAQTAAEQGTLRQRTKMNYPVFWFILGIALLPGLGTFFLLSVYNVLWWDGGSLGHGIWPQAWKIAAFPPPYDTWAQMSIEWVFDPMKLATTTGVAVAGGWLTGKKH